jgi:hypothetical protein
MGTVTGKVTYKEQPVTQGMVVFYDPDQGRAGGAKLQQDGSFRVVTIDGQGLRTGTYQVAVRPPFVEGTPHNAAPNPSGIPARYFEFETSGLTMTVAEGENPPLLIELMD